MTLSSPSSSVLAPSPSAAAHVARSTGPLPGPSSPAGTSPLRLTTTIGLGLGRYCSARNVPAPTTMASDSSRSRSKTTWSVALLIDVLVPLSPVDAPSTVETMLARSQGPSGAAYTSRSGASGPIRTRMPHLQESPRP